MCQQHLNACTTHYGSFAVHCIDSIMWSNQKVSWCGAASSDTLDVAVGAWAGVRTVFQDSTMIFCWFCLCVLALLHGRCSDILLCLVFHRYLFENCDDVQAGSMSLCCRESLLTTCRRDCPCMLLTMGAMANMAWGRHGTRSFAIVMWFTLYHHVSFNDCESGVCLLLL